MISVSEKKRLLTKASQSVAAGVRILSEKQKRTLRHEVTKAVHIQQFEKTEKSLTSELTEFFREQVATVTNRMDAGYSLEGEAFQMDKWNAKLFDVMFPILTRAAFEAGLAQLHLLGIRTTKPRKEWKSNECHDDKGRFCEGGGGTSNESIIEDKSRPLSERLEAAKELLAEAAQKEYDSWDQDEEGMSCEVGSGGICDGVAGRMQGILSTYGIDSVDGGQEGDDHAWLIAYTDDEAFGVDIPPNVYEAGGGYSWKKLPDVKIEASDVQVWKINRDDIQDLVDGGDYDYESDVGNEASFRCEVKSAASDWLEDNGLELPQEFITKYPKWFKKRIKNVLEDAFDQDYWDDINQTTLDAMERTMRQGLTNGLSIKEIADELRDKMDDEYYRGRSENIARTESGNVLNSVRKEVNNQLIEEVGDEVPIQQTWLSVLGTTTRAEHADLDGVPADKNGMWTLVGIKIPWPGHTSLPVEQRARCQCTISTEFGMSDATAHRILQDYYDRTATDKSLDFFTKGNPCHDDHGRFCGTGGGNFPDGGVGLTPIKLDRESLKVIQSYQDNSYEINGYLREGPIGYAPSHVQRQVIKLQKVFDRYAVELKEDTVLYRGMDESDLASTDYQENAFQSTTTTAQSAAFFGDLVMKMNVPKGTKVLPVLTGDEKEVLLPRHLWNVVGDQVGQIERRGKLSKVVDVAVTNTPPDLRRIRKSTHVSSTKMNPCHDQLGKFCSVGGSVISKMELEDPKGPDGKMIPGKMGKLSGIETGHWNAQNNACQWAMKKIHTMEKLAKEGNWDELLGETHVPKSKQPNTYQKAVIKAHANLLKEKEAAVMAAPEGAIVKTSTTPPVLASTGWTKTGGQLGTETGGVYSGPDGKKYYVKQPENFDRAHNEILAGKLLGMVGGVGPKQHMVEIDGKKSLASEWQEAKQVDWNDPGVKAEAAKDFAKHAWLANWDVIGANGENTQKRDVDGKLLTLDVGGALEYRAAGGQGKKPEGSFGDKVQEWDTLRDPNINPGAANVFKDMTPQQLIDSVESMGKIKTADVAKVVNSYHPGTDAEKKQFVDKMMNRYNDLQTKVKELKAGQVKEGSVPPAIPPKPIGGKLDKYKQQVADAVKAGGKESSSQASVQKQIEDVSPSPPPKPKIDASLFPKAPEFISSNKEQVKKNQELTMEALKHAHNGDIEALKGMPLTPSPKLKSFHTDLVNNLAEQLNPPPAPKKISSTFHEIAELIPAKPTEGMKKVGHWNVMYELGGFPSESVKSWNWGEGESVLFQQGGISYLNKLNGNEQSVLKDYTGGAYEIINKTLRTGEGGKYDDSKVKKMALTAANAAMKASIPIPAGTRVSRAHGIGSLSDINDLKPGSVLSDKALLSTSTIKDNWSGDVQWHLTAGPGVKGVPAKSFSNVESENEIIFPPNTRVMVKKVTKAGSKTTTVEAVILPFNENQCCPP